jgi:hypothetical protein
MKYLAPFSVLLIAIHKFKHFITTGRDGNVQESLHSTSICWYWWI